MLKPVVDTHTHTIASQHAYSTVLENVAYAKKVGLLGFAVTDHAPAMKETTNPSYFSNIRQIPKEIDGIRVLKGVELNIMDRAGNVDLPEKLLNHLEITIASCHSGVSPSGSIEENTQLYQAIAQNPYVDIIGHCGQSAFTFDYEEGIKAFKAHGKIVEINACSFLNRPGSVENCPTIAKLCKKYEVPIVISSDAHFATLLGRFDHSIAVLEEIDFPKELILNLQLDTLLAALPRAEK